MTREQQGKLNDAIDEAYAAVERAAQECGGIGSEDLEEVSHLVLFGEVTARRGAGRAVVDVEVSE